MSAISFLDIFLGMLGFGLSILFCTAFCRACSRIREEQIQREIVRRSEQEGGARSIYFIPFPGNLSLQDPENPQTDNLPTTPTSGPSDYLGPPPSYSELGIKPDDLPPAYSEHILPMYSVIAPPHTDMAQSQVASQP